MNNVNHTYFTVLLRELRQNHGELPFTVNSAELTKANTVAHRESSRSKIIQIKDLSYGFDNWLSEQGLMFMVEKNGSWCLRERTFEREITLPPTEEAFTVNRVKTLMGTYLDGGLKATSNETKSLHQLYVSGAFQRFYEAEELEFIASTGRTRTSPIKVRMSENEVVTNTGIQIESDGALAFTSGDAVYYSPIEAKESVTGLWWRQLFYPYWNDKCRHPDAQIFVTVVLRESGSNNFRIYAIIFENESPMSFKVLKSATVTIA